MPDKKVLLMEISDGICLPLPTKESYSRLNTDGKLDIVFDLLIVALKNQQSIHEAQQKQKASNMTIAGGLGLMGAGAVQALKYVFTGRF